MPIVEILDEDELIEPEIVLLPADSKEVEYKSWQVYLDDELIDTVLYLSNLDAKQVRCRLIIRDDYPVEIVVIEEQ